MGRPVDGGRPPHWPTGRRELGPAGSHAGCVEQSLQRAQQSMNQALLDLERQAPGRRDVSCVKGWDTTQSQSSWTLGKTVLVALTRLGPIYSGSETRPHPYCRQDGRPTFLPGNVTLAGRFSSWQQSIGVDYFSGFENGPTVAVLSD